MRFACFAAAIMAVGSAALASEQEEAFHHAWKTLTVANPAGANAALDFRDCNVHFAQVLALRSDHVPKALRPIEAEAREASEQCAAEAETLAKAISADDMEQIIAIVLKINLDTITRARREKDQRTWCAGSDWKACRWKAIPPN